MEPDEREALYQALKWGKLREVTSAIERLVALADRGAVPRVLERVMGGDRGRKAFAGAASLPFWVHAYWLLIALGDDGVADELARYPAPEPATEWWSPSAIQQFRYDAAELGVRTLDLRGGGGRPGEPPASKLPRSRERLRAALDQALGAEGWVADDDLVPLLADPPWKMTCEGALWLLAAALLHVSADGLRQLAPVATHRAELQLLLAARGVAPEAGREDVTADDLLATIYADPEADGPRRVFADWPSERDHPRAPLFGMARATVADPELLAAWDDVLGPLAPLVFRDSVVVERGLVTSCRVRDVGEVALQALAEGPPLTATLRRLELSGVNQPAFSEPDRWRSLRSASGMDRHSLRALAGHPKLEAVAVRNAALGKPLLAELRALPALRWVRLSGQVVASGEALRDGLPELELLSLKLEVDDDRLVRLLEVQSQLGWPRVLELHDGETTWRDAGTLQIALDDGHQRLLLPPQLWARIRIERVQQQYADLAALELVEVSRSDARWLAAPFADPAGHPMPPTMS